MTKCRRCLREWFLPPEGGRKQRYLGILKGCRATSSRWGSELRSAWSRGSQTQRSPAGCFIVARWVPGWSLPALCHGCCWGRFQLSARALQTLQLPPSVLCLLKPPGKGPAKGYAQKSVSEFSSENSMPGRKPPNSCASGLFPPGHGQKQGEAAVGWEQCGQYCSLSPLVTWTSN